MFDQVNTNRLKIGSMVMMHGHPCKVTDYSKCKTGKHGAGKIVCEGKSILTGKAYEESFKAQTMVDAPVVKKVEYTLLNIGDDNYLNVMMANGETKDDVKLPEDQDLVKKIQAVYEKTGEQNGCYVTVLATMGVEQIIDVTAY